jgi:hypothetical protein
LSDNFSQFTGYFSLFYYCHQCETFNQVSSGIIEYFELILFTVFKVLAGLSPVDAAITAEEERIRKEEIESLAIEEKVRTLLIRTDKRLRNDGAYFTIF